jgi:hypothetical protein
VCFEVKIKSMAYLIKTFSFAVALSALMFGTCCAQETSVTTPENGFISPEKYTNAFFGFSPPLPQGPSFTEFRIPSNGKMHNLYGMKAHTKNGLGLSAFIIVANEINGASSDQAREAASSIKGRDVKRTQLVGKEFWKSEIEDNSTYGKIRTITYATAINGYVLKFQIIAFDGKLAKDFEQCIEALQFFDPAKAETIAGVNSRPHYPAALDASGSLVIPSSKRIGQLSAGVVSGNTYTNDSLGLTYEFPSGWAVADNATLDKVIEAGHEVAWGNSASAARERQGFEQCGRILLAASKYQEGTKTSEFDSKVAVIAVDLACSPDMRFPNSLDDREGINAIVHQLLNSFAGAPFRSKQNNFVKAFKI